MILELHEEHRSDKQALQQMKNLEEFLMQRETYIC